MSDLTDFYRGRHVEREILSALIDGELDADQRRFVHEHLQECAPCREAVEEFSQIHGLVGELPRLVAPASFVSEVLEPSAGTRRGAPARAARRALSGRRGWLAAGLAAAAVSVTLAGLVVPPPAREPPIDVFIERHVGVHSDAEPGAQVLVAVNGR